MPGTKKEKRREKMGREKRIQLENAYYHIIDRGNNGIEIFKSSEDKTYFLKILSELLTEYSTNIYAYALMDNHYHLLIKDCKANLSNFMHRLKTKYTHHFNSVHATKGHLFQDRFRSIYIKDDEQLLAALIYIYLNPFAAGLTEQPEKYRWASLKEMLIVDSQEQAKENSLKSSTYIKSSELLSILNISKNELLNLIKQKQEEILKDPSTFEEETSQNTQNTIENSNYKSILEKIKNENDFKQNKTLRKALIFQAYSNGLSRSEISQIFDLSIRAVNLIVNAVNKKIQENAADYIAAIQIIRGLERKTSRPVPGTKREENSMHKVFIGIGTNLGDRSKNIEGALKNLESNGLKIVKKSPVYETEPYGLADQPRFLNCAVEANTTLSPQELLMRLLKIEKEMGRERKIPQGPRIIDLDILFYGNLVINEESLIIPHPDLQNRFFVLKPLSDIAPDLLHPVFKKTIKQMLKDLENLPEKPEIKTKNE